MNSIEQSIHANKLPENTGRSIGAILIDAGLLSVEQAESALRLQKESGARFGDAALKLGFVSDEAIRFALAQQFDYPYLPAGDSSLGAELVAAYTPYSPLVENLRALRTQLMLRCFDADAGRKALAVVSPEGGDGRSFIAANLAVVFSQLGERTLLIDADLRHPRQKTIFKLSGSAGLSDVIAGRAGEEAFVRISSLLGLSVLHAGAVPPNPQELLGRANFAHLLDTVGRNFDVVILDTPAASDYADGQTIAGRAGSALMIARKHQSSASALAQLARNLQQAGTTLVGSVLNDV